MNQSYVIATSTKIDLKGVKVPAIDDEYFTASKEAAKASAEDQFFENNTEVRTDDKRKADQKAVDDALVKVIAKTELLKEYLSARFSLNKNDKPHKMKF